MELNQIEKVLKTKAKRELEIIVENFTKEVAQLCNKYSKCSLNPVDHTWLSIPLRADINGKFDIEHVHLKELKKKLEYALNDSFLEQMIIEKSKELVKKLDVL